MYVYKWERMKDNDKIMFISYNRPLSLQHLRTAQKQTHQKNQSNRKSTSPSATSLQIHTSKTYSIKSSRYKAKWGDSK